MKDRYVMTHNEFKKLKNSVNILNKVVYTLCSIQRRIVYEVNLSKKLGDIIEDLSYALVFLEDVYTAVQRNREVELKSDPPFEVLYETIWEKNE
jgi:hypothetical protein